MDNKDFLLFEKNGTYVMFVSFIQAARREFIKSNVKNYVHDIYFVDDKGNRYKGEYITQSPTQQLFNVGLKACFKCTYVNSMGCEIEPQGDPRTWGEMKMPNEVNAAPVSPAATRPTNMRLYAMQMASNLKSSEVTSTGRPTNTPEFIGELFTLATEIENYLSGASI